MTTTLPSASPKTKPGMLTLSLAITMVLWASAFPLIKSAGQIYGAGELATLRFSVATLALAIAALVKRSRLPRPRDIPWFLLTGLLGVSVYHLCLNYGEQFVSAGTASLIVGSAPVFAAVFAVLFLKEKIGPRRANGILVSFAGVSLLVFGKEGRLSLQPEALYIVVCAVCAAIYVIVQKKYLSTYTAIEFTLYTFAAGTLELLPLFARSTTHALFSAPAPRTLEVIYLGIFPAAMAYMTFAYATVRLPASRVMSFMYLIPAVTMAIAFVYLREEPSWLSLIGGALAIGGVVLVNAGRRNADTSQQTQTKHEDSKNAKVHEE